MHTISVRRAGLLALCLLLAVSLLLPLCPAMAAAAEEETAAPADTGAPVLAGSDGIRTNLAFSDIGGHWAWAWIQLAYQHGLVSGISSTQFAPNQPLTRAMFVTLLYRAAGCPKVSLTTVNSSGETVRKHYFSDVEPGKWYEIPAFWAYETGLTSGTEPGRFSPDLPAAREQMCVFIAKFAALQKKTLTPQIPKTVFADDRDIAAWARDSVYLLQRCRLVAGIGDGNFAPKKSMTRAEATVVLVAYLRLTGQLSPTKNLVDPAKDISYEQMMTDLRALAIEYPALISVSSAGTSAEGRDIPLVTFGKGSKYIYTQGNIHAREHQTTNFILEVLDEYAYAYETGASYDGYNVRALLDQFTLEILPRVNPDGTNIAQKGFNAAKDPAAVKKMIGASKGAAQWKANAKGVDLNRNFPCYWAKLGTGPANEGYGGPSAASEPETKAVIAAMKKHSYVCYLDIHMAGNVIYFCNPGIDDAFYNRSKTFAQRLCSKTGYTLAYSNNIKTDHSAAAYARNEFRNPSLTVELTASTVFPHDSAKFSTEIWKYVKDLYLEAMTYYK